MMTQITTKNDNVPAQYTPEQVQLLKDTFFKGASDNDLTIFSHICRRTGLDPFVRQIYPVMRKDNKLNKLIMTVQTGIDGFRLIADRTNKYSPGREPTHAYDGNGRLLSATAYIKKQTADGTWHEVCATAFYSEYVQTKFDGTPTSFWIKMPHSQLAKCAEALALRKAFPMEMSGIYTNDEMAQANSDQPPIAPENLPEAESHDVTPPPPPEPPKMPLVKLIDEHQADTLRKQLEHCTPEFKAKLKGAMADRKFQHFMQFTERFYNTVMKSVTKHIEELSTTQLAQVAQ